MAHCCQRFFPTVPRPLPDSYSNLEPPPRVNVPGSFFARYHELLRSLTAAGRQGKRKKGDGSILAGNEEQLRECSDDRRLARWFLRLGVDRKRTEEARFRDDRVLTIFHGERIEEATWPFDGRGKRNILFFTSPAILSMEGWLVGETRVTSVGQGTDATHR